MKRRKMITGLAAALLLSIALGGCGTAKEEKNQKAADEVAALIDAIYVQERTDKTDEQCAAAKKAWDALTPEQQALVQGEYADPDYFGLDTGDAAKDDPLNQDEIGENEILAVSFGTSYNDSRTEDIGGVEAALQAAYPDWSVRRAFTSQIIINHVQARDGECMDNVEQALERAVANGVKNLIVQPTHLMHGSEYDELADAVQAYSGQFDSVKIAEPLLGAVGEDATVINEDKAAVAEILTAEAVADSGYGSLEEAAADSMAYVFMGHGTSHTAKVSYSQMQTQMDELGYDNVFVGTVEGEPEETACEAVIQSVADKGYKKIVLRPLMVVAGDHANNDMAGADEDSWASRFTATGDFDRVDTQIEGLGRIPGIQQLYVEHTGAAMAGDEMETQADETNSSIGDGRYLATFRTDSSMFHVNEACDGKGTLTVENGRMTIHISLVSKNIVNLYVGLASDAQKEGAVLLEPTEDTVTYSDGTSEEVYGFDVPVPALDQEFDLALLGTKGTWYDHKVSVSDPVAIEDDTQTGAAAQWEDGTYSVELTFSGGSGKAKILSPATVTIKDGAATARIQWSSENYDYMLVDGEKYLPLSTEGGSVFEIPVQGFDVPLDVIGDTVAMSTPHEIAYTIVLAANTMTPVE